MSQRYSGLLNDKEFCFSLIGLNSIFSTLPQSEYTSRAVSIPRIQWVCLACSEDTSREVYSGLCLFLSIVYSVFQRCPTRDEISFPVGQRNCKKKTKSVFIFQNHWLGICYNFFVILTRTRLVLLLPHFVWLNQLKYGIFWEYINNSEYT